MIIRAAILVDHAALCDLFEEVDALHREAHPRWFRRQEPPRSLGFLRELLEDKRAMLRVAEAEGAIIGFVHACLRDVPEGTVQVPRTYVYVDAMAVRYDARRGGIGGRLLDEAITWGAERGALEVVLDVYDFNTGAIAFYEAAGFSDALRRLTRTLRDDR